MPEPTTAATSSADPGATLGTARRWGMLAVSTLAQMASAVAMHGPAPPAG